MRRRSAAVTAAAAAVLLAACGGGAQEGSADPDPDRVAGADEPLAVAIASYDLAVGDDRRLLAGIYTGDMVQVAFGEVDFQLGYLGDEPGGETELGDAVAARYLPVPGLAPEGEPSDAPTLLVGRSGSGVYEGSVSFDEPGFYGLRVVAELEDGTTREGQTTFEVRPEHEVPDVGDAAPPSENLTIADVEAGDAPPVAVDSRAQAEDAEVPDPILHDSTVASAIESGTPAVVALTTPTYCQSVFCGPLTTTLAELAPAYEGEVDFIHIEVWRDFEAQELNEAAAEWIQTEGGGNEPWVFLVGADGTVEARWDNVLDVADLEERLAGL